MWSIVGSILSESFSCILKYDGDWILMSEINQLSKTANYMMILLINHSINSHHNWEWEISSPFHQNRPTFLGELQRDDENWKKYWCNCFSTTNENSMMISSILSAYRYSARLWIGRPRFNLITINDCQVQFSNPHLLFCVGFGPSKNPFCVI